jgi:hypothetical protein
MIAPFPWFGGKRKAAHLVWAALGDVGHYIEPFAGSLAVLLGRPDTGRRVTETVNDLDGNIVNFWRAVAAAPDEVARHADWPVIELDLTARHHWLVTTMAARRARIEADADYYCAKSAGWWVWGLCSWIGTGWCSGDGPWVDVDGTLQKLPHLGNAGQGINKQLPHLGDGGRGINKQLPHFGNAGQGIAVWFRELADRLRGVRIACGDWRRVLSYSVVRPVSGPATGIFLDPPYITGNDVYASDGAGVAEAVATWAAEHGDDPTMRIVLAGYDGEVSLPASWRPMKWKSSSGLHRNTGREVLWISPHCVDGTRQPGLFEEPPCAV